MTKNYCLLSSKFYNFPLSGFKSNGQCIWCFLPNATLFLALLFLTSCTILKSSAAYTKGTQCLEKGDYPNAVHYLEEAVKLGPEFARNHTNLAAAYQLSGDGARAWCEIRSAVLSPYQDSVSFLSFCNFYNALIKDRLDQPGTDQCQVMYQLGEPDIVLIEGSQMIWVYGLCFMHFEDGKMVQCRLTL